MTDQGLLAAGHVSKDWWTHVSKDHVMRKAEVLFELIEDGSITEEQAAAHLRTLPRAWARERVTTPVQPCGCRRECTSAVNFVFYAILREAVGNCESEGDAVSERAKAHSPLRVMVRGASW